MAGTSSQVQTPALLTIGSVVAIVTSGTLGLWLLQARRRRRDSCVEKRLMSLGYSLPTTGTPKGSYVMCKRVGNLIYTAGHIPTDIFTGNLLTGTLGVSTLSLDDGKKAAELCALSILATLKRELGDLNRVAQFVKLTGFVNSNPEFQHHPQVVNGASELLGKIFDDRGVHSRSAVGVSSLPMGCLVEIEAIVEVKSSFRHHMGLY